MAQADARRITDSFESQRAAGRRTHRLSLTEAASRIAAINQEIELVYAAEDRLFDDLSAAAQAARTATCRNPADAIAGITHVIDSLQLFGFDDGEEVDILSSVSRYLRTLQADYQPTA